MTTRSPDQWRKAVLKSDGLRTGARLYLTYLAEHMSHKRIVSRPRHLIAKDLNVSVRTVDYWNTDAIEAGFLTTIRRGQKGVTAVYQGLFPGVQRANCLRAETDAKLRAEHAQTPVQRAKDCAPLEGPQTTETVKAPVTATPRLDKNRGNEEHVPSRAVSDLTLDWWEREPPEVDQSDFHVDREAGA